MRGIDREDQLIGNYIIGRRSRKWWKQVYSYNLEVDLLNLNVLHKSIKKKDFLNFRLTLAVQLVGTSRKSHNSGQPHSFANNPLRLDSINHTEGLTSNRALVSNGTCFHFFWSGNRERRSPEYAR